MSPDARGAQPGEQRAAAGDRRVHGPGLLLARATWAVLVALTVGLILAGLAASVAERRRPHGVIAAEYAWNAAAELVLWPHAGGVAARAGIGPGDVLLAIDGTAVPAGMPIAAVRDRLEGAVGAPVALDIRHDGVVRRHTLTRAEDEMHRAETRLGLPDAFGVIYYTALEAVFMLAFLAMGAVLFWRRSDDWLLLFLSLTLALAGPSFSYTPYLLWQAHPEWIWAIELLPTLATACLLPAIYLLPDGRFVPRWTAPLAAGWVAWVLAQRAAPLGLLSLPDWPGWAFTLIDLAWYGSAIVAQVYRYLRVASPLQRQQTRWVVAGLVAAVVGYYGWNLALSLVPTLNEPGEAKQLFWLIGRPLYVACLVLVPAALGLAVLRHRLWDLDLVINRALVYGALTASVAGIYVLVVGALGAIFQAGGNLVVSLLATGLVAVIVQPLRDRLQRAVNRLLYGERDEPYAALARLGRRLEATLEPAAVLPTLVQMVAQALKLPYAAIALRQDGQLAVVAVHGAAAEEPLLRLPLAYGGEAIGELALAPRSPGEPFSSADRRLLGDLARQAGVAAHAVLLTADLERSRRRVVAAREEARRRLGSDLHDGLGHRLAGVLRQADRAAGLVDGDPAAARRVLADLAGQTRALIAEVRGLAHALHPPDLELLGLAGALRERAQQGAGPGEAGVRVSVEAAAGLPRLPAAVEAAAYYIAQEALANVHRHAGARRCHLRLALAPPAAGEGWVLPPADAAVLELEIRDDGRGLADRERAGGGGLGLASMRERAAELGGACVVEPAGRQGTRVYARLPVTAGEPRAEGEDRLPSAGGPDGPEAERSLRPRSDP